MTWNYQILKRVRWSPSANQSTLLTDAGFAHGFVGVAGPRPENAHHLKQVHGVLTVHAKEDLSGPTAGHRWEGDALWTDHPQCVVSVKTADCLPLLLADPKTRRVMALHAGWRGLTGGLLAEGVKLLLSFGSNPLELIAAIGPAISRERYEVGEDVTAALFHGAIGLSPSQASLAAAKGQGDRWHLDLKVAAVCTLFNAGLTPEQIDVIQACTFGDEMWHSYRREGRGCGSNWSWITP